nr:G protein-activated inward rectifier potassium channel 3-like [Leptinotarsa decemlineata]
MPDSLIFLYTHPAKRKRYGPNISKHKARKRAILKSGEYNIIKPKFTKRYLRYVKDIFTSLVDAEWKWTLQVMVIGFLGCWLTFALLWWLIAFVHTDLHEDHLPTRQAETGWIPCVLNINGFHSCFLYSLETQHTTGYGFRAITEECPEAIFLMCAQCIIGMIIDSFTVGVVFAKLTRPRMTTYTIQFSRNAVVCLRDGELCMMFRVGDLRKSRLVGVSARAIVIHSKRTIEGERLANYETKLEVQCDDMGSDLFMVWPLTIIHKIDNNSPFFNLSASEMLHHKFEIVIILDGVIESTGQSTHARTSYLENEILWGRKFENIIFYNEKMQCYEADYEVFDYTVKVETPSESAAELLSRKKQPIEDTNADVIEKKIELTEFLSTTNDKRRCSLDKFQKESSKPYQRKKTRKSSVAGENYLLNSTGILLDRDNLETFNDKYFSKVPPKNIQSRNIQHNITKNEHYKYVHQEDKRSETPPFPVNWV